MPNQKLIEFTRKSYNLFCISALSRCHQRMEVEHESFQSSQPIPGLQQDELPKKIRPGLTASLLGKFGDHFPDKELNSISSEEILSFLTSLNDTCKQLTKHTRYAYLKALFNFIRNNLDAQLQNPCDTPTLKKLFRPGKLSPCQIHEKEVINEIIFRTPRCETVSCWSSWPGVACGSVRF